MARRLKLLTNLSAIAMTGAAALSACGGEGEGDGKAQNSPASAHHGEAEGGEAEGGKAQGGAAATPAGGEAEGAGLADVATDKAAFLSGLQIVHGHLKAGVELYAGGDRTLGPQHLRHPQAEILTSLAPAFAAHGASSIEPAIDALAAAGEAGADLAEIRRLESAALAAITTAGDAAKPTLKERLIAVSKTLSVAGDEYAIAVKDGAVQNLHEYHDAYGFIAVAIADVKTLKGGDDAEEQAIATALDQAMIAATAAPVVAPPAGGLLAASVIYGAAARIEIAARSL